MIDNLWKLWGKVFDVVFLIIAWLFLMAVVSVVVTGAAYLVWLIGGAIPW